MELRAELNAALAEAGEKVSVNDLIVRACALALVEHPQAHRSYVDGQPRLPRARQHRHRGGARRRPDRAGRRATPTRRALRQIAAEARDLAGRARDGQAASSTRSRAARSPSRTWGCSASPTFPRSSTRPSRRSSPSARPSQRPVVVDGQVVVRPIMRVTLSVDHRACSGADGARLLQTIKRYLQAPSLLLAWQLAARYSGLVQLTDVMSTQIVSVAPATPIGDAARRMIEADTGAAMVLARRRSGRRDHRARPAALRQRGRRPDTPVASG